MTAARGRPDRPRTLERAGASPTTSVRTAGELRAWMQASPPGAICEWWRGRPADLARARQRVPRVAALAAAVTALLRQGTARPFQVEVKPGVLAYRLERLPRPPAPATADRPCYITRRSS